MNALAEHLLDPHLSAHAAVEEGPTFALHVQHEKRAVTVAAAVFYVDEGVPVVIVNGLFRPAEFEALSVEVAEFNADPQKGWSRLAFACYNHLVDEAEKLEEQVRLLRRQADELDNKHILWA